MDAMVNSCDHKLFKVVANSSSKQNEEWQLRLFQTIPVYSMELSGKLQTRRTGRAFLTTRSYEYLALFCTESVSGPHEILTKIANLWSSSQRSVPE